MLFTKKIKFSLIEKQIKEEILSEDGKPLLKLNLKYPEIQCPKKDPLRKNALPFYQRLAEGLLHYAKNDFLKSAKRAFEGSESFMPFSVVMRWTKTHESEKYLSILIEISFSDGKSEPMYERKTQIWERKFGTKCRFSDFFDTKNIPHLIDTYIGSEHKKRFERDTFTLNEDRFEFFIRDGNGYLQKSIPISESINKSVLTDIK